MKKELVYLVIFLLGIASGMIITIGVKYPLKITELERADKVCKTQKVTKLKIGITGKIYEVTCDDNITYELKN